MSELPGLPERLVRFIRSSLPDYASAVLLVKLARTPERGYSLAELEETAGTLAQTYVDRFARMGLVRRDEGGFVWSVPEAEEAVADLVAAYEERPVTLVRLMDRIAGGSLESFADAFRLRKEEEHAD